MEKVVRADCRPYQFAKGVPQKMSIGAGMNDLKDAYRDAIELATKNGSTELVAVLEKAIIDICAIDDKVLDAICELQD